MPRTAYVNGRYVPHARASVHIEDRGYQFADGVYEVAGLRGGLFMDMGLHMARLERSLGELSIAPPMSMEALKAVLRETVRRNRLTDGYVYFQITRGVAPRDHAFPAHARSALVVTAKRIPPGRFDAAMESGIKVICVPDRRWQRRDIKSIALLPNILAKQEARAAGAYEAWQVEDGVVTEGSSTNAWIVTRANTLMTHPAGPAILNGVTRQVLLQAAKRADMKVEERPFTPEETYEAAEAFISSSSAVLLPVVEVDGKKIGQGTPGPVARKLRELYEAVAEFSP